MPAISVSPQRNPVSGKLHGSYFPIQEGVNFMGLVGHGSMMTITDSLARFGTRTNVKPLFVNLGDSRFGSSLGRITTEHINSATVSDTVIKAGALASSWKLDLKQFGEGGIMGQPIITQNQTRPLIQYIERRYGFDFADPTIHNNGYYFSSPPQENTRVFTLTVDGRTYTRTNDGTATSISNGFAVGESIKAEINADTLCKCTVTSDETFNFRLVKKSLSENFIVTYNSNVTQNFNNKCNRIYAWDNATINNAILLTRGAGGGSVSYMENTNGNAAQPDYNAKSLVSAWMGDGFVLRNSSAPNVSDGYYRHYRNSELLNPTVSLVTHDTGEQPIGRCFLNQLANGPYGYWRSDLLMHVGYQCWDDEFLGIYLADSATIVPATTKLVRQPQATWTANSVSFQQVHSLVNPSGAYIFLCTAGNTFTYIGVLPA